MAEWCSVGDGPLRHSTDVSMVVPAATSLGVELKSSNEEGVGALVARIKDTGFLSDSGLCCVGDRLQQINGTAVPDMALADIVTMLGSRGQRTLLVFRSRLLRDPPNFDPTMFQTLQEAHAYTLTYTLRVKARHGLAGMVGRWMERSFTLDPDRRELRRSKPGSNNSSAIPFGDIVRVDFTPVVPGKSDPETAAGQVAPLGFVIHLRHGPPMELRANSHIIARTWAVRLGHITGQLKSTGPAVDAVLAAGGGAGHGAGGHAAADASSAVTSPAGGITSPASAVSSTKGGAAAAGGGAGSTNGGLNVATGSSPGARSGADGAASTGILSARSGASGAFPSHQSAGTTPGGGSPAIIGGNGVFSPAGSHVSALSSASASRGGVAVAGAAGDDVPPPPPPMAPVPPPAQRSGSMVAQASRSGSPARAADGTDATGAVGVDTASGQQSSLLSPTIQSLRSPQTSKQSPSGLSTKSDVSVGSTYSTDRAGGRRGRYIGPMTMAPIVGPDGQEYDQMDVRLRPIPLERRKADGSVVKTLGLGVTLVEGPLGVTVSSVTRPVVDPTTQSGSKTPGTTPRWGVKTPPSTRSRKAGSGSGSGAGGVGPEDRNVQVGDVVLAVNYESVEGRSVRQVAQLLLSAPMKVGVYLRLARAKTVHSSIVTHLGTLSTSSGVEVDGAHPPAPDAAQPPIPPPTTRSKTPPAQARPASRSKSRTRGRKSPAKRLGRSKSPLADEAFPSRTRNPRRPTPPPDRKAFTVAASHDTVKPGESRRARMMAYSANQRASAAAATTKSRSRSRSRSRSTGHRLPRRSPEAVAAAAASLTAMSGTDVKPKAHRPSAPTRARPTAPSKSTASTASSAAKRKPRAMSTGTAASAASSGAKSGGDGSGGGDAATAAAASSTAGGKKRKSKSAKLSAESNLLSPTKSAAARYEARQAAAIATAIDKSAKAGGADKRTESGDGAGQPPPSRRRSTRKSTTAGSKQKPPHGPKRHSKVMNWRDEATAKASAKDVMEHAIGVGAKANPDGMPSPHWNIEDVIALRGGSQSTDFHRRPELTPRQSPKSSHDDGDDEEPTATADILAVAQKIDPEVLADAVQEVDQEQEQEQGQEQEEETTMPEEPAVAAPHTPPSSSAAAPTEPTSLNLPTNTSDFESKKAAESEPEEWEDAAPSNGGADMLGDLSSVEGDEEEEEDVVFDDDDDALPDEEDENEAKAAAASVLSPAKSTTNHSVSSFTSPTRSTTGAGDGSVLAKIQATLASVGSPRSTASSPGLTSPLASPPPASASSPVKSVLLPATTPPKASAPSASPTSTKSASSPSPSAAAATTPPKSAAATTPKSSTTPKSTSHAALLDRMQAALNSSGASLSSPSAVRTSALRWGASSPPKSSK